MPASPSRDRSREPSLADLLEALDRLAATGFHEVDLRVGGARIRVSRGPSASPVFQAPAFPSAEPAGAVPPPPETAAPDSDGESDLEPVTAPMVGTFYRRSRPEAEPFVTVGDRVKKGQVLCIIEAMKLMNSIEAETDGEVVEILAEDAAPVQFGDRLFLIRPG